MTNKELNALIDEEIDRYLEEKRKKKKARREEDRLASEKAEADRMEKVMSDATTMSAGGKTRTKPIDGIAIKGKTRGRMI